MHQLSPISKAIISASQWDILDFEDINKELAYELTDYDISTVLKSINAQDVLKRLKLCGCINITGLGLNPLRGSVVLEQIDISLVGKHEESTNDHKPEPKLSQEVVVSILNGIVSASDCKLKYIKFPYRWRGVEEGGLFEQFQGRYNTMFMRRNNSCSHCNTNMSTHRY